MSIFRLIRGELQKILLRPLMYIITIVLVLGLIGSVILFGSTIHNREDTGYIITGENKTEIYTNYLSNSTINKNMAEQKINSARSKVDTYSTLNSTPSETATAKLKTLITSAKGELEIYKNSIQATDSNETDLSNLTQNRDNLKNYVVSIRTQISEATQGEIKSVLVAKSNYDAYIGLINGAYNYLNSTMDTNSLADHKLLLSKLVNTVGFSEISGTSYFDKLDTLTKDCITDVVIDEKVIKDLQTKYEKATTYMTNVNAQIDAELNDDKIALAQFKNTVLSYFYTSSQYVDLVEKSILYYPVQNFTDSQINKMIGYSNVNTYELRQSITRDAYMIENNLTDNTTAYVFSSGISFSNTASALDLVYFGLEICGFIIIVLCIVLVASMIASENARGTLRVQCLRPYSKRQILSSKIWATLFLGVILLLFSALVLFIAGWIMFGLDFTSILAVFNSTNAFIISPIAMIFVYIGLFVLKMIFYIMLAAMLATMFRNDIAAIIVPILIYVANAVLAFIFTTTMWYAYVPFACVDLFKFFGGGFALAENPISIILSTPLFYNSNFVYSVSMFAGLLIIMTIISHICFKKREIR